jgi:hypothetical protein
MKKTAITKTAITAVVVIVLVLTQAAGAAVEPPPVLDPNTVLIRYDPNSCPSDPVDWIILEPNETYEIRVRVWKLTAVDMDFRMICANPVPLTMTGLPIGREAYSNGWIYNYRIYWTTPIEPNNVVFYWNMIARNHVHPKDLRPVATDERTYLCMVARPDVPIILQPNLPELTAADLSGRTPWQKVPRSLAQTLTARGMRQWQANNKKKISVHQPAIMGITAKAL